MKITKEQIENWVGGDSTVDACLSVLEDLVNREYSISEMRNDVIDYNDDEDIEE